MRVDKNSLRLRAKTILVAAGIIVGLGMIEVGLRAGRFFFISLQAQRNERAQEHPAARRIMCLGESTTAMGGEDSYPAQLERILNQRNRNAAYAVINKGLPACNSATIAEELERNIIQHRPEIIVVMMGINDDFPLMAKDEPAGAAVASGAPRARLQINALADWLKREWGQRGQSPKLPMDHRRDDPLANDPVKERLRTCIIAAQSDRMPESPADTSAEAVYAYVRQLISNSHYEAALKTLRERQQQFPQDGRVYWFLARCFGAMHGPDTVTVPAEITQDPWGSMARGWQEFSSRRYLSAAAYFEQLLGDAQVRPQALMSLGWSELMQQNPQRAAELFDEAGKYPEAAENSRLGRAWTYYQERQWQKAAGLFLRVLEDAPRSGSALRGSALCQKQQEDTALAKLLLRQAIRVDRYEIESYGELASLHEQEKNIPDAVSVMQELMIVFPGNRDGLVALVRLNYVSGSYAQAAERLDELLQSFPDESAALRDIARQLSAAENFVAAEKFLRTVIELRPSLHAAPVMLASCLNAEGKYTEAREILQPLLARLPDNTDIGYQMGMCLRGLKDYQEAALFFQRVLAAEPGQERAYEALRMCYADRGQYDEALSFFESLQQTHPDQVWPSFYRGLVYYNKSVAHYGEESMVQLAMRQFERVLELDPSHNRSYHALGLCYRSLRRGPEAVQMFTRALELDPDDGGALYWLTLAYQEQGDYTAARRAVEHILALNVPNAWAFEWMGDYRLEKEQDYAAAAALFEKVIAIVPEHERVYLKLKRCYEHLGEAAALARVERHLADFQARLFRPATYVNYRRLATIAAQHNINIVCVSYPCRSVAMVRNALRDFPRVSYVDNEQTFKDALRTGKYEDYFIDSFAGDFGHCTAKGNRLLAENVARAIFAPAGTRDGR